MEDEADREIERLKSDLAEALEALRALAEVDEGIGKLGPVIATARAILAKHQTGAK